MRDLEVANKVYAKLLQTENYKTEKVKSEGVETSFFKVGESKIELLAATSEDSPIAKFLAKRGEGVHHIAFHVDDIRAEMKRLKEEGFELISKRPKKGADNKLVAFLHPNSANGVLVELCQEIVDEPQQLPEGDEVWES